MRRKNGFTLVELLTVIGLMIILASFLLPALNRARQKARVAKCIATIASLQTALGMYQVDYGVYPPSTGTSTQHNGNSTGLAIERVLVNTLAAATTEGGPYMEFKGKDLDERISSSPVLLDPWGQAYIYVCQKYFDASGNFDDVDDTGADGPFHPASHPQTRRTYNIYSLGPDQQTDDDDTAGGNIDYSGASDWDESQMFDNVNCGDWKDSDIDRDNARYDDINSWDGAR